MGLQKVDNMLISDFHVHSKYAYACSEQLNIKNIDNAAKEKGIDLLGTGDFTHPLWIKEIKDELSESEEGIYESKSSGTGTRFILSSEVCTVFGGDKDQKSIFDKSGSVRKIHNCILAPSIEIAEAINSFLSEHGSLVGDGRPILSISAEELVEGIRSISNDAFIFPAHAWTPWFGVFGSMSGFDSLKMAYGNQSKHIHALETGLSSDPSMNWRLSSLDDIALLSGSDAHSLPNLGREATVIDIEKDKLSYKNLIEAIKKRRISRTIEFYPEEGKYHYDGHRKCNISMDPSESRKFNNLCPVCRRRLTIGVMHRIDDLADRPDGFVLESGIPFSHIIPLQEIIAFVSKKGKNTNYVKNIYSKLISTFGNEFHILLKSTIEELGEAEKDVATAIENIREERVNIIPGYDGVFGIIDLLNELKEKKSGKQKTISDF